MEIFQLKIMQLTPPKPPRRGGEKSPFGGYRGSEKQYLFQSETIIK